MATHFSILAWRIPMDRGAWWATVHRVTQSQERPNGLSTHAQVKDVAYNLKYIGESILKVLTFKGISLFHSYSD